MDDAARVIDAGGRDASVMAFINAIANVTLDWRQPNQNLPKCRRIAAAFVLARVLFFCAVETRAFRLMPGAFHQHQATCHAMIAGIFSKLVRMSQSELNDMQQLLRYSSAKNIQFFWCIDDAHVLRAQLDVKIISEMPGARQPNGGDMYESSKRGILSVLLDAIRAYFHQSKIVLAGTSADLRHCVDNFGSFESKPVHPYIIDASHL